MISEIDVKSLKFQNFNTNAARVPVVQSLWNFVETIFVASVMLLRGETDKSRVEK